MTIDDVEHEGEDETCQHDSTYHWTVCEVCEKSGVKLNVELHSAGCTDVKDGVGTCWWCEAENVKIGKIDHDV